MIKFRHKMHRLIVNKLTCDTCIGKRCVVAANWAIFSDVRRKLCHFVALSSMTLEQTHS